MTSKVHARVRSPILNGIPGRCLSISSVTVDQREGKPEIPVSGFADTTSPGNGNPRWDGRCLNVSALRYKPQRAVASLGAVEKQRAEYRGCAILYRDLHRTLP